MSDEVVECIGCGGDVPFLDARFDSGAGGHWCSHTCFQLHGGKRLRERIAELEAQRDALLEAAALAEVYINWSENNPERRMTLQALQDAIANARGEVS